MVAPLRDPLLQIEVLPVRVAHVDRLDELGDWHRDPFDRLLVAQALAEGLTLASKDALLGRYGVPVVWNEAAHAGIDG